MLYVAELAEDTEDGKRTPLIIFLGILCGEE
jgi:hypothetical protein